MTTICIYHGGCADGFTAAWVVRRALGDAPCGFHPAVHGEVPPDCTGRDVIMVDFTYPAHQVGAMARVASSLLIIDHHKTAREDLVHLPEAPAWDVWRMNFRNKVRGLSAFALFDERCSGAGLAWDYFFPNEPRPAFVNYVEDRDLWARRLYGTDQFTAALRSYEQTFENWDRLAEHPDDLIDEGESILRYYRARVDELKKTAFRATFDVVHSRDLVGGTYESIPVVVANAPGFMSSDVAGELAAENPGAKFAACFSQTDSETWTYQLRSRDDYDVSKVARAYGGGGHKNAAGFKIKYTAHNIVRDGE